MNPGAKPLPDEMKVVRGTFRPGRALEDVIAPLTGETKPPKWLKGMGLRLWKDKVGIYERRGQSVVGCESALAQYCAVEADLIDRWKRGTDVPVALINAHRIYANEFYDTPASQQAAGKPKGAGNRFAANGRPPDQAAQ